MRILFQYFSGGGGGLSNVILLLKAYVRVFPQDNLVIVCSEDSDLNKLASLPNVIVVQIPWGRFREWTRFRLGVSGLKEIVRRYDVDVVWSLNLGSYFRLPVPNLIALNNAHQVYPWEITRYHPGSPFRVALLRQFFRRSLRVSDAALVQTPLMASYVKKIKGAPRDVFIVSKAVEQGVDVLPEILPEALLHNIEAVRFKGFRLWLYVATAMPHKNHRVLLEAFSELDKNGSADCLVLTISEEEAISIGSANISNLTKNGRLIFTGWMKKVHLRALYDACDACVMPSLLESLSSTHLEAMEWGKPQIIADLPYARDLCGNAALYVDASESAAWVNAIQVLGSDTSLQQHFINMGRSKIAEFPSEWGECAGLIREKFLLLLK